MSFGKRVKKLREANRLSVEQLAHLCQIEPSLIEKLEYDLELPTIRLVQFYARQFHVSTDYLLGMTDRKERIMEVVTNGKSIGDVVIQMLIESGMIRVTDTGDYEVVDTGIILTEKQQRILDLVRRHNYLRILRYELEDLGHQIEETVLDSPQQQTELIELMKKRLKKLKIMQLNQVGDPNSEKK